MYGNWPEDSAERLLVMDRCVSGIRQNGPLPLTNWLHMLPNGLASQVSRLLQSLAHQKTLQSGSAAHIAYQDSQTTAKHGYAHLHNGEVFRGIVSFFRNFLQANRGCMRCHRPKQAYWTYFQMIWPKIDFFIAIFLCNNNGVAGVIVSM